MHVEIWSDIACPWCYVGKRRFETALAASSTPTTCRSRGAASSSTPGRRPSGRCRRRAPRRQVRHVARAGQRDERPHDRGRRRRGPRVPLRARPRRQHVRRAPARPPRRRARQAGRDEGAPDARLPHRGRADERPRRAAPARGRGRAARGRGRRAARGRPLRRRRARRRAHRRSARHPRRAVLRRRPPVRRVGRAAAGGARRAAQHAWEARPQIEVVTTGDSCGIDGC